MTLADRYAAEIRQAFILHEIVLRTCGQDIGLTCTCQRIIRRGRPGWTFIDIRSPFPAAEVIACWRTWHKTKGIEL